MPTAGKRADTPGDTLGGRISLAREATGLSEAEAAQRLGVLARSWTSWERDRDVPRANRLATMAGILGVSLSWLLSGDGDGPAEPAEAASTDDAAQELMRELRQASRDVAALNRRMNEIADGLERIERANGAPEPAN